MKITDMRVTPCLVPLHAPLRFSWGAHPYVQRLIVELETDDGRVGLGEAYGDELRAVALEHARRHVIGASPYDLERLRWHTAAPGLVKLFQGPVAHHTYAALEFACLDLIGQQTDRPLCDLLGGRLRERVDLAGYLFYRYPNAEGSGGVDTPEQMVEHARALIGEFGFRGLKFKCGVLPPEVEVETFIALRRSFPDLKLRLDPNGVWSISTAVSVARRLVDHGIEYLEDPTWSLRGLARVAAQVPGVTLASNQAVFGFEDLPHNLHANGVDVVLADPHWYGGARACVQLSRTCETFGLDVGMHSGTELGISQAVQLHVAAASPSLGQAFAVDSHYPHLMDDVIEGGLLPVADGSMAVPDGPGLGVRLDRDRLERYHTLFREREGFSLWTEDPFADEHLPVIPRW